MFVEAQRWTVGDVVMYFEPYPNSSEAGYDIVRRVHVALQTAKYKLFAEIQIIIPLTLYLQLLNTIHPIPLLPYPKTPKTPFPKTANTSFPPQSLTLILHPSTPKPKKAGQRLPLMTGKRVLPNTNTPASSDPLAHRLPPSHRPQHHHHPKVPAPQSPHTNNTSA